MMPSKKQVKKRIKTKAKDSKTSPVVQLPGEIEPLHARALLERSNPVFQQAQYFYIEPSTTLAGQPDEEAQLFSMTVEHFLSHQSARVLLLLGDADFDKSTASQILHQNCWQQYQIDPHHARISIHIHLKHLAASSVPQCIDRVLRDEYYLTTSQIVALKKRPCLIILEGFDAIIEHARCNLWDSNKLNEWHDVGLIVTYRDVYLKPDDIKKYFYPKGHQAGLMQGHISSLSLTQTQAYLQKAFPAELKESKKKRKREDDEPITEIFTKSSELQKLLREPLTLKIFVDALPELQQRNQDLSQLNRFLLYSAFMQQWFVNNATHLGQQLGEVISDSVWEDFLRYAENLAATLYKAGQKESDYPPSQALWKQFFTTDHEKTVRLRSSCPLRQVGNQYNFIHKSFLEFFVAQKIIRSMVAETESLAPLIELLSQRSLRGESQILAFLHQAHKANKTGPHFTRCLFAIIAQSARDPSIATASANAATILNSCEISLAHRDFRGVQLPGADLSYGVLAHSDLRKANLQGTDMWHTVLYQADLRGTNLEGAMWGEWPHLRLEENIGAIAHHPTQPWLAIAQGYNIVLIHRDTGVPIGKPFIGHTKVIEAIAFSHDGSRLASGGYDGTVRLWDIEQQTVKVLKGHKEGSVNSVTFSSDGLYLASGGYDKTVRLWDAKRGVVISVLKGHKREVNSVAFSPDSRRLVSGSYDTTVRVWDVGRREQIDKALVGHQNVVNIVVFSPDGELLASGSTDGTVRLWDVERQILLGVLTGEHTWWRRITSIAFSHDGRQLASGSDDHTIRLWDIHRRTVIGRALTGHKEAVHSVFFSPDDETRLVSASDDKTVRQWDVRRQKAMRMVAPSGHTERVKCVAVSPDGRRLASSSMDYSVRLWDAERQVTLGKPLMGLGAIHSVAFNSDGHRLVSGGAYKAVYLWDTDRQTMIGKVLTKHTWDVTSVTFSPNGRRMVSASADKTLLLWDAERQEVLGKLIGHTSEVTSVTFNFDGSRLASGSKDKAIHLWDVEQRAIQGKLLGHTDEVTSVAFSGDGSRLASGSKDKTVRLWDVERQTTLSVLNGHTDRVTSVAFSPDGSHLASSSTDDTVRLWDIAKQQCVGQIRWHQAIHSVAFHTPPGVDGIPTADWLVMGDEAGTISVWEIARADCRIRFVGMPKHGGMPLLAEGAQLQDCQMSPISGSLLAQHGASTTGVILKETKEDKEDRDAKKAKLDDSKHSPSIKQRLDRGLDQDEKLLFKAEHHPKKTKQKSEIKGHKKGRKKGKGQKDPLNLFVPTSSVQAATVRGFMPIPNLQQQVQLLVATIGSELKRHPEENWNTHAAAKFAAKVLAGLRENNLNILLDHPEKHVFPTLLVPIIRAHLQQYPGLAAAVSANSIGSKQLEAQLLATDNVPSLSVEVVPASIV